MGRPRQRADFNLHQPLGGEGDHLAQHTDYTRARGTAGGSARPQIVRCTLNARIADAEHKSSVCGLVSVGFDYGLLKLDCSAQRINSCVNRKLDSASTTEANKISSQPDGRPS
jgi:hypothetical protein